MKTLHTFEKRNGNQVAIVFDIEITGILSWFWGLTVGKKHANGLPQQTALFLKAASEL